MIRFHLMFALPCLFVISRFLWPLPWSLRARLAAAIVLLLASQYHLYSRLSSGSVFSPEFPQALVIAFNWAFSVILLLALLQLALDVATILASLVRWRRLAIAPRLRYGLAAAAMALAVITFLAGSSLYTHVEPTERCPLALPTRQCDNQPYNMYMKLRWPRLV